MLSLLLSTIVCCFPCSIHYAISRIHNGKPKDEVFRSCIILFIILRWSLSFFILETVDKFLESTKLVFGFLTIFSILIIFYNYFVQTNKYTLTSSSKFQFYYNFQVIVFTFLATPIIAFFKELYETSGTVYPDEFITIVGQGGEYKNNYVILGAFFLKHFVDFIPSFLFVFAMYKVTPVSFRIKGTTISFTFHYIYVVLLYLASGLLFLRLTIENGDYTSRASEFMKYSVMVDEKMVRFPKDKKNIIFLSLEAMENIYLSKKNGGIQSESVIPNLEQIALDNMQFSSNKEGLLGGMTQIRRGQWTIGATTGFFCGYPMTGVVEMYGNSDEYLMSILYSKMTCLPEILQANGYSTSVIMNSQFNDWAFGYIFEARKMNWTIASPDTRYAPDWKLFEVAKQEINKIKDYGKPFYLYAATLDTHEPGFKCQFCNDSIKNIMHRVASCSDKTIKKFLDWCKEQPWYNNTVIIMTGDHKVRGNGYDRMAMLAGFHRTNYNAIINSQTKAERLHNRKFIAYDWFPTVLAAAGAKIASDQLGFGVNLFSNKKTLIEEIGPGRLEKIQEYMEKYYYDHFIVPGGHCDKDQPCLTIANSEQKNTTDYNMSQLYYSPWMSK